MHGRVVDTAGTATPGVMISDGHTLSRTAMDGAFTIDPRGPFVFLTRPAGYTAAPWFVPATAENPTFTLVPHEDVFPYRFVHVSDLHVSVDNGQRFYPPGSELGNQDVLARFLGSLGERADGAQSVIATGDLTDLGLDDEYTALRAAVETSRLPVHLLPGNHDHIAGTELGMEISRTGYLIHGADTAGYERHLGPRWYSFDLPGLHVVALDWHTHELGLDHQAQDAWLQADLESVGTNTPWILLSHDQPWHSILDGLPSQPVATFSGHRHTSRVVQVGQTLHVNTPTPLFAGLDYSPPSFRIVRWDGERIGLETRAIAPTGLERATFSMPPAPTPQPPGANRDGPTHDTAVRWRHQLSGAGHRSPVRIDGDRVIAGVKREDEPSGAVEVLDLADGSLIWRAELRASVKGTPTVHHGDVICVEVSGDVVSLAAETGAERWRIPSPDPLRLFAWADPVVAGGNLLVGDLTHVRALDPHTGDLRWERCDLCSYQTLASQTNPVIVGDTLVLGNFPAPVGVAGFDIATGETRWTLDPEGYQILGALWPIGTPLFDEPSDSLYVPTPSGLAALQAGSGKSRWRLTAELPFSPATPASTPDGITTVLSGRDVVLLDRIDGSTIWRTTLVSTSHLAMASYTRTPQILFAGPTASTNEDGSIQLLVTGLDGHLHALDATTGDVLSSIDVGAPIAAPAVISDSLVLTVAVDGTVTAIDQDAIR